MPHPLISVCIPAYNRAEVLAELLESIVTQKFNNFEIIICEDLSPQRKQISKIVNTYQLKYPDLIYYYENEKNLGYDANLRNLIEKSHGKYCFFMGNDDLMCPNALFYVSEAVNKHANIGVVLRSYAAFEQQPDNIVQTFRYFDKEIFFPAGAETIATIYRRSVVIPGMVLHREEALKWSSDLFDGYLLYQLYLVSNILVAMNAVFLPEILVLYRNGGVPDFGNSDKEKGKFTPTEQTPESSIYFMQGMLNIAKYVETSRSITIYSPILHDIGNYSYPILAIQSKRSFYVFAKYSWGLAKLGFWKNKMFYVYFFAISILGTGLLNKLIVQIKNKLGRTPIVGKVYRG